MKVPFDLYPLIVTKDRYTGTYSGGKYTAWNHYFDEMPMEIEEDDTTCCRFWAEVENGNPKNYVVGVGDTPQQAVENLFIRLKSEHLGECPFCHGKAELATDGCWYVECLNCFARTGLRESPFEAIHQWNEATRAEKKEATLLKELPEEVQDV